ncbi:hypothetical protein D3C81_1084630 [compost metagenome]
MHTRAGDRFVAVHQLFAFAEGVQHHGHRTQIQAVGAQPHQVVQDAGDFVEHGADVLRTLRHLDTHQGFDGTHVGMLVAHHRAVIQAIHVADRLVVRLGFGQLLGRAVQQTNVRIGTNDGFAIHFQNQAQHTMRGRMLRAEVHRVVADLLPGFGGIAGKGLRGLMEFFVCCRAHLLASVCARSPSAVWKRASSRITRGTPTRGSTEVTGSYTTRFFSSS